MIKEKYVEVVATGPSIKRYKDLGYNAEWRKPLIVKVEDLPPYSMVKVTGICDLCGKETGTITYSSHTCSIEKTGSYCCSECIPIKREQTMLKRYGVGNSLKSDIFKEKIKQTCIERYGVENPLQSKEIQEKIKETLLEKYGAEHPSQSPIIQEKIIATNLQRYGVKYPGQNELVQKKMKQTTMVRYGVENVFSNEKIKNKIKESNLKKYGTESPMQNPEVVQKRKDSFIEKYGVENPMQLEEIKHKLLNTLYKNGTAQCSIQQQYIHNLYGGELNYPYSNFLLDIAFPELNTYVEYNGGGHNLQVKLGSATQEEFDQKEIVRNNVLKKVGWKRIVITSPHDKLPPDYVLLHMLSISRQYFGKYPNHSWIEWQIDENKYRTAETPDGVFFDYGQLKTIRAA